MSHDNGVTTFSTWIEAQPEAVAALRHRIDQWLDEQGVRAERRHDIVLATDEAIANAIEHSAPTTARVDIALRLTADTVTLTVANAGIWKWPDSDAGRTHGWGLHLINSCATEVHIGHTDGTVVLTAHFDLVTPGEGDPPAQARQVTDLESW